MVNKPQQASPIASLVDRRRIALTTSIAGCNDQSEEDCTGTQFHKKKAHRLEIRRKAINKKNEANEMQRGKAYARGNLGRRPESKTLGCETTKSSEAI